MTQLLREFLWIEDDDNDVEGMDILLRLTAGLNGCGKLDRRSNSWNIPTIFVLSFAEACTNADSQSTQAIDATVSLSIDDMLELISDLLPTITIGTFSRWARISSRRLWTSSNELVSVIE
jgi:hypothetical protein